MRERERERERAQTEKKKERNRLGVIYETTKHAVPLSLKISYLNSSVSSCCLSTSVARVLTIDKTGASVLKWR